MLFRYAIHSFTSKSIPLMPPEVGSSITIIELTGKWIPLVTELACDSWMLSHNELVQTKVL
jgi:hypothetical protein